MLVVVVVGVAVGVGNNSYRAHGGEVEYELYAEEVVIVL